MNKGVNRAKLVFRGVLWLMEGAWSLDVMRPGSCGTLGLGLTLPLMIGVTTEAALSHTCI